ncbi:hypothetical protein [Elizabethkingia meningoseptica]|uniref:hypothetical protein n=1 Tax=Elizabethkingia meningoseptica TaxID=238 RepID=UPI00389291B7
MKKILSYAPLWGALTLSLLSSCRTEDNIAQQNISPEKRFNVFVPTSTSEKIDYANGFAYLMKRSDELHKSNMSGINNKTIIGTLASTGKNTSAFQDTEPYVEFNIRSEMTTEKNGDKWLVFPKVQGNKVIALVLAYLSKQETSVNYYTYREQHAWFKENVLVYQNALNKLQKRNILSLSASIKPMAGEGLCPPNTVPDPTGGCMRIGNIDGVTITVPAPADSGLTGPDGGPVPSNPGSGGYGCEYYNSCYPTPPVPQPKIDVEQLKDYPCAYAIAKELTNEKIGSDLAKLIKDTFDTGDKTNITFQAKEGMGIVDGQRTGVSYKDGVFNATIDLNADVLRYATKEYILVTMYHEAIHAYIGYQVSTLPYNEYLSKFPKVSSYEVKDSQGNVTTKYSLDKDHMNYGTFINGLTNIIKSYNPKISNDVAEAMAKWGVVTDLSNDEILKNNNERDTRNGNNTGTKCAE